MYVKNFMTSLPLYVNKNVAVEEAAKLMHEKNIRQLPVVDDNKLIGILTFPDIMAALPSRVSKVASKENSDLAKTLKVKDALPPHQKVITINENACIEEAALIMRAYRISCLPVLDATGRLIGMCTESDIFDAFIDLLGVRSSGTRIVITTNDQVGVIADICEIIKQFHGNISKIGFLPKGGGSTLYQIIIRLKADNVQPIIEALTVNGFQVESSADYGNNVRIL